MPERCVDLIPMSKGNRGNKKICCRGTSVFGLPFSTRVKICWRFLLLSALPHLRLPQRSDVDIQITDRQNVDRMTKNVARMTENVDRMTKMSTEWQKCRQNDKNVDRMTDNVDRMTENVDRMTENVDFIRPLLSAPRGLEELRDSQHKLG
jgi:hypothetical protein